MRQSILILFILFLLCSCTLTSRLKRKNSNASISYIAKPAEIEKKSDPTPPVVTHITRDSSIYYLTEAITDEHGEQMMKLELKDIVVTAKTRTVAERLGEVTIHFSIELPKELQGSCKTITITPFLHNQERKEPLQQVMITGSFFSKVQHRDYWQYEKFVNRYNPDSTKAKKAFGRFIRFPLPKETRLDSVIERREAISYFYSQSVPTAGAGKRLKITLEGAVTGLDGSVYALPTTDTLLYNISSILSLIDTTTRYVTRIVEKYATVVDKNYLSFKLNDTQIIDTMGDNKAQLNKITDLMGELITQKEFIIDSIFLTATASPEGDFERNTLLSKNRAFALKTYLSNLFPATDSLITVHWIGEDWEGVKRMIGINKLLKNRDAILKLCAAEIDPDKKERGIKKFTADYSTIRERIYPFLRSVHFEYHLRRMGMIQDTIHTTEKDTLYTRAIEWLTNRSYAQALSILSHYEDRNTAIALLSLGHENRALNILLDLPHQAPTAYLIAIAYARLGKIEQAKLYFEKACMEDPRMKYRSGLDPELSTLN